MSDITQKNSDVYRSESERTKERDQTLNSSVHFDTRSLDACCQAAQITAVCSGRCVGCVLTADDPFHGLDGIEPRTPVLGDLGSAELARYRTSPYDPGVKATLSSPGSFSCF